MKKIVKNIFIALFLLALVAIIVWTVVTRPSKNSVSVPPKTEWTIVDSQSSSPDEKSVVQQNVVTAVQTQVPDSNNLAFPEMVVVKEYALSNWTDGYTGGTVVLHKETTGWKVIAMDGGVIDAKAMISIGVPSDVASELVSKLPKN